MAAKAMNVQPSFVSKIRKGDKPMPEQHAPTIELLTGGAVTCEEMCPHVKWHVLRNSARPVGAGAEACAEIRVIAAPDAANDAGQSPQERA